MPPASLLLVAVAAAGCDAAGRTAPILPAAEAEAVAVAVADVAFDALFRGVPDAVGAPASEEGEGDRPLEVTVECAGGGSALLAGVVTGSVESAATYEVDVDATLELSECAVGTGLVLDTDGPGGVELDAAPAALDGDRIGDQTLTAVGVVAGSSPATGAGAWQCGIALDAAHDPLTRTRVVAGTVCGRELEASYRLDE